MHVIIQVYMHACAMAPGTRVLEAAALIRSHDIMIACCPDR